jgi:hydroxymethylbilane synthase
VGQGALGIECRVDDEPTRGVLAAMHDLATATCVAAERGVLVALEGDCKTPLAAFAERHGEKLHLRAFVAEPDGSRFRGADHAFAWPGEAEAHAIGLEIGRELKAR